jgi:hypothetical protein
MIIPAKTKAKQMHVEATQKAFNFSVMTCYAVETLRVHLDNVEAGKDILIQPYYYSRNNTPSDLRKQVNNFETNLASNMLLSVFSFFEDFVTAIVSELIEFQGGENAIIIRAEDRDKKFVSNISSDMEFNRRKLRTIKHDSRHKEQYKKYSKLLKEEGYRFPTETFSSYGIRGLMDDLTRLKANALPKFLMQAFHIPLDPKDIKFYHEVRELRNQIAHGKIANVNLKKVSLVNDLFHRWTSLIDEHLLVNYFIAEDYS